MTEKFQKTPAEACATIPMSFEQWIDHLIPYLKSILEEAPGTVFQLLGQSSQTAKVATRIEKELFHQATCTSTAEEYLRHDPDKNKRSELALVLCDAAPNQPSHLVETLRQTNNSRYIISRRSFQPSSSSHNSNVPAEDDTPLTDRNITFVIQGSETESRPHHYGTADLLRGIRYWFPESPVIFSTWRGASVSNIPADVLVLSEDPGALPFLKKSEKKPNNINRQLLSTRSGLDAVKTTYAAKIRSDALIVGRQFLDFFRQHHTNKPPGKFHERIMLLQFYTLSMTGIERLPLHYSDLFHFGKTEDLLKLWSAPQMTIEDATWFEKRAHVSRQALTTDFLARLAVEQHIAVSCFYPELFCDCDMLAKDPVWRDRHNRILRDEFIVIDYQNSGISLPKFEHSFATRRQIYNCMSYVEWQALLSDSPARKRGFLEKLRVLNYRRLGR